MKRLPLLVGFVGVVMAVTVDTNGKNISSVTFKELERFLTTDVPVFHMELDLYKNDGSILFSTYDRLQTTDGEVTSTVLFSPDTRITGFVQLNITHIALVGNNQHCIKLLNRVDNTELLLAGLCGTSGFVDGNISTGRLDGPWGIRWDARNPDVLLVTDRNNNALRYVDLVTRELSTVSNTSFNYPRGMAFNNNTLYVSNFHYISEVNWDNNGFATNTELVGSTYHGLRGLQTLDGSFDEALFAFPLEIVELRHNLYLIADEVNYRVRVMNTETRRLGPVCFRRESACVEGSQTQANPYSILVVGQDVYLGMLRHIDKLVSSNLV